MNAAVVQRSHKALREWRDTSGWTVKAACLDYAPELWFPETAGRNALVAARRVCAGCPVRAACLEYALTHQECGVWGGLSEDERREILKRRSANR